MRILRPISGKLGPVKGCSTLPIRSYLFMFNKMSDSTADGRTRPGDPHGSRPPARIVKTNVGGEIECPDHDPDSGWERSVDRQDDVRSGPPKRGDTYLLIQKELIAIWPWTGGERLLNLKDLLTMSSASVGPTFSGFAGPPKCANAESIDSTRVVSHVAVERGRALAQSK